MSRDVRFPLSVSKVGAWVRFVRAIAYAIADALLVVLTALAGLCLRFEGTLPPDFLADYAAIAAAHVVGSLLLFGLLGLYRRLWAFAGLFDAVLIVIAATAATAWASVLLFIYPGDGYSRAALLAQFVLLTASLGGIRLLPRIRQAYAAALTGQGGQGPRVLIAGAGAAGRMALREIRRHPALGRCIAFLDDDPAKVGARVDGVPVLGRLTDLEIVVQRTGAGALIVAMPSAAPDVIEPLVFRAKKLRLDVKVLPAVHDLIRNGTVQRLREIELKDLLEREPVQLDRRVLEGLVQGRTALVTGGGGSIGSEICRQLAALGVARLVVLDHAENPLYETTLDLRYCHPELQVYEAVADIRDPVRLRELFQDHRPDLVFHAAAHKHVHLMEAAPAEAIKTNVLGTWVVAEAALASCVERFVLISTDKAVNPRSFMGVSKRVAELIMQYFQAEAQKNGQKTRFIAVRFGNVLGSRGSVVPVFEEQIRRGGPVSVTHPDMERYFMTVDEAVQLVLQAAAMGEGGEVFVLNMGAPVKIADLARKLIRLHGLQPEVDIPIVYTGPRPGEKLREELLTAEEGTEATAHGQIFRARVRPVPSDLLLASLDRLRELTGRAPFDVATAVEILQNLVPTFQPTWRSSRKGGHAEAAATQ